MLTIPLCPLLRPCIIYLNEVIINRETNCIYNIVYRKVGEYRLVNEAKDPMKEKCLELLNQRGVKLEDIGDLVYFLQEKYVPDLKMESCLHNVDRVISKREVQNAIMTGIYLDMLAENNQIEEPLLGIIQRDEGLYGVDEVIALSIVNVYGSIGFTNYGYIDKLKPGILEKLNDKSSGKCHTFLDDIVGAIAASASSRLAHSVAHVE
jgi:phosphatidylglycerophosphatase A